MTSLAVRVIIISVKITYPLCELAFCVAKSQSTENWFHVQRTKVEQMTMISEIWSVNSSAMNHEDCSLDQTGYFLQTRTQAPTMTWNDTHVLREGHATFWNTSVIHLRQLYSGRSLYLLQIYLMFKWSEAAFSLWFQASISVCWVGRLSITIMKIRCG